MIALVTAYDRHDLLKKTLVSFFENQKTKIGILIHEDSPAALDFDTKQFNGETVCVNYYRGLGQHGSIEKFIIQYDMKYYLHLEEDWEFNNSYDWISESKKIMEDDALVIKVICVENSPHPCEFEYETSNGFKYGYLKPWRNSDGHLWHGFGWNPGLTRLDLMKEFLPITKHKWEQDISEEIYIAGYKTVLLQKGVCKHIGGGRSTHE